MSEKEETFYYFNRHISKRTEFRNDNVTNMILRFDVFNYLEQAT